MGANQKYSGRIHTKRQLGRAVEHIKATAQVLFEVQERYEKAVPLISEGCERMLEMIVMLEALLEEIKGEL